MLNVFFWQRDPWEFHWRNLGMLKGAERSQKMNLVLLGFWSFCQLEIWWYLLQHFISWPSFVFLGQDWSRFASENLTLRCVSIHLRKEALCEYYWEKGDNLLHKIENWVHICLFYATLCLFRWVHISTALLSKCIMCRNGEKIDYFKVSMFFYKMYWYISSS